MDLHKKTKALKLNVNAEELNEFQIRMLKRATTMLVHVMTTKNEGEYFEGSSELLKIIATTIKDSNFSKTTTSNIPYGSQALEYSLDLLTEEIHEEKIIGWDN